MSDEVFQPLLPINIEVVSERTDCGPDGISDFLSERVPEPLHVLARRHLLEQRHFFALHVERLESQGLRRHYAKSSFQSAAEPLEGALDEDTVGSE